LFVGESILGHAFLLGLASVACLAAFARVENALDSRRIARR
jgi:hypothetical protein